MMHSSGQFPTIRERVFKKGKRQASELDPASFYLQKDIIDVI